MNLDEMFGSFNPSGATAPNNSDPPSIGKKRKPETLIDNLEAAAGKKKQADSDDEMVEIAADVEYDGGEEEDLKLAKEGEAMLAQIKSDTGRVGYDSADYKCITYEYDNCTHEFVAPKDYERPKDWKRPKVKPKQYKFTLDKF